MAEVGLHRDRGSVGPDLPGHRDARGARILGRSDIRRDRAGGVRNVRGDRDLGDPVGRGLGTAPATDPCTPDPNPATGLHQNFKLSHYPESASSVAELPRLNSVSNLDNREKVSSTTWVI